MLQKLLNDIKKNDSSLLIDEGTILELVQKLKSGNLIIDGVSYNQKQLIGINDIVAVHVTSIAPNNDMITTRESSQETRNMSFTDPSTKIEHTIPYLIGGDTIHFTLNCVVENHQVGNDWDNYKYGVLVDLSKLNKKQILDTKSEDTYMEGNVYFNSPYYLFCPVGEKEVLAKANPNAIIVEYQGITLNDAISAMIILLGKKLEPYGTYGWGRNDEYGYEAPDVNVLEEIVTKEEYPVLKGMFGNLLHSESKYMAKRMWKREYEALISLIQYNQENGIDMPLEIIFGVMLYGGAYSLPGSVPVTIEDYKEVVFPILQKNGYVVDDSIFEGITIDGGMKLIYEGGNGVPVINCPKWENELRSRVINLILAKSKKYN